MIRNHKLEIKGFVACCDEQSRRKFLSECAYIAIDVFVEWAELYKRTNALVAVPVMRAVINDPTMDAYDMLYRLLFDLVPDSEEGQGANIALNSVDAILSAVKATVQDENLQSSIYASICLLNAIDFMDEVKTNGDNMENWWSMQDKRLKDVNTRLGKEWYRQKHFCCKHS